jgi:uncharacterized protein YdbL (DUF1318 family)
MAMTRKFAAPLAVVGASLSVILACVTINVYFPEKAIKDLSKQIEEQVQKQAAQEGASPEAAEPEKTPGPTSGLLDSLLGITPAYAQGEVAAPEISSPAIRKIIDSRAARVGDLNKYKGMGVIGESNQGLAEARSLDTLPDLKARAEVQKLVKAENLDREALFHEIAVAKKVEPSQIPKIRETYASTLRDNARPGDWIQLPDGAWKKK